MDRETNNTANFQENRYSAGRLSEPYETSNNNYNSSSRNNIYEEIAKIPRSAHYTNVLSRAQHVLERSAKLAGDVPLQAQNTTSVANSQTSFAPKSSGEADTTKKTHAVLDKANKILERSASYNKDRWNKDYDVNEETFAERNDYPLETFAGKHSSEISQYDIGYTYNNVAHSAEKGHNPRDILSKVNQVLQSSSKLISDHANSLQSSGNKHVGFRSLGHSSDTIKERDFETPQRSNFYRSNGDNKLSMTSKSVGTTEFESRIPENIHKAYQSVMKRSQELIFKTEDEYAKSVPRSQISPKKDDTDRIALSTLVTDTNRNLRSPARDGTLSRPLSRFDMSPPGVQVSVQAIRPKFVEEYLDDGTVYRGEKIRTQRQGRGELIEPDGSKYDGEWENDKKNGYGVQMSASGHTKYDGEWRDDLYHGNGIMVNPDPKEQYNFDFKNFETVQTNWIKYEGEFMNGRMHGLGTLTLFGNERFVGKFKYNKVHGAGVFHRRNGDVISGEWEDNHYVRNV